MPHSQDMGSQGMSANCDLVSTRAEVRELNEGTHSSSNDYPKSPPSAPSGRGPLEGSKESEQADVESSTMCGLGCYDDLLRGTPRRPSNECYSRGPRLPSLAAAAREQSRAR